MSIRARAPLQDVSGNTLRRSFDVFTDASFDAENASVSRAHRSSSSGGVAKKVNKIRESEVSGLLETIKLQDQKIKQLQQENAEMRQKLSAESSSVLLSEVSMPYTAKDTTFLNNNDVRDPQSRVVDDIGRSIERASPTETPQKRSRTDADESNYHASSIIRDESIETSVGLNKSFSNMTVDRITSLNKGSLFETASNFPNIGDSSQNTSKQSTSHTFVQTDITCMTDADSESEFGKKSISFENRVYSAKSSSVRLLLRNALPSTPLSPVQEIQRDYESSLLDSLTGINSYKNNIYREPANRDASVIVPITELPAYQGKLKNWKQLYGNKDAGILPEKQKH